MSAKFRNVTKMVKLYLETLLKVVELYLETLLKMVELYLEMLLKMEYELNSKFRNIAKIGQMGSVGFHI